MKSTMENIDTIHITHRFYELVLRQAVDNINHCFFFNINYNIFTCTYPLTRLSHVIDVIVFASTYSVDKYSIIRFEDYTNHKSLDYQFSIPLISIYNSKAIDIPTIDIFLKV